MINVAFIFDIPATVHIHPSAITLGPLTGEVRNSAHLANVLLGKSAS